jgi:hypothetical protein
VDSEKIRSNFEDTFPLLKQYKKAVYKVQDFSLVFGLSQDTLLEKIQTFSRETLEIDDVRKLHSSLQPKLESLRHSISVAAKLNLEVASTDAVPLSGLSHVYSRERPD